MLPLPKEWIEQPVGIIFNRIARQHPDRLAISDGVRRWTYAELADKVAGLAALLCQVLPRGEIIGLALANDARMPAAMLAALESGLIYVPLDLSFPAERNGEIIRHSGVKIILTTSECRSQATELAADLRVLVLEDAAAGQAMPARGQPGDVAYVLYTSGSTGRPKGVYQNQRNLLHDIMQYVNSIQLTAQDRLTLLYSPSVNGAIRDMYGALLTGAALHVVDLKREGLGRIAHILHHEQITIYHSMPPVLRAFLGGLSADTVFESVRMTYLAGDRLFRSDVDLCRRHFPVPARIYVGLGSTENATIFRQWFIEPDTPLNHDFVPTGYPVEDRPSVLIGHDGHPVRQGEIGEIVVSSRHMALGYWNDPELSAAAFLPCPDDPQARRFHTGDVGREETDGLLHFLGRKDRQIKVRGYRVEPAEVEAVLRRCPSISDVAVVAEEFAGDVRLVAFVVPRGDGTAPATWLATRLPPHMQPKIFISLVTIPALANFKPDYETLRLLARECQTDTVTASLPLPATTPEAVAICQIWTELLGAGSFERNDTLAEAGGDSLQALKLLLALEQKCNRPLSPEILSMMTRPSDLLSRLRHDLDNANQPGPVVILLPGILSADIWTVAFAERLRQSMTVEVIDYRNGGEDLQGKLTEDGVFGHIRAVVERYGRPHRLWFIGHSFGARIAFEAARLVENEGITVELLAAIDGGPDDSRQMAIGQPFTARAASWVTDKRQLWRQGRLVAAASVAACVRVSVALAKLECFHAIRIWLHILAQLGWRDAHVQARRHAVRNIRLRTLASCARHKVDREIILFSTGDPGFFRGRLPDLGWSRLCSHVRTVPIKGPHVQILAPEYHQDLAATLERMANSTITKMD